MAYREKRPCRICIFRNKVLPLPHNTDESPTTEIHTPVQEMQHTGHPEHFIRMQTAKHEQLPDQWLDIVRTRKLCAGSPLLTITGLGWFRFPTRNMRPLSPMPSEHLRTVTESITDVCGRMIHPAPTPLILCFTWCALGTSSRRTRRHQYQTEFFQTQA